MNRGAFMMRSLILGSVIFGFACVSTAAIESVSINDARTLREKLTGIKPAQKKMQAQKTPVKSVAGKKVPTAQMALMKPAQKGLALAREAKNEKNYILAIKRYNFILKYFSKTAEARQALLDKSEIYKDMGLEEQSQFNKARAQKLTVQAAVSPSLGNKIKK